VKKELQTNKAEKFISRSTKNFIKEIKNFNIQKVRRTADKKT